jgi:hypothetical protein
MSKDDPYEGFVYQMPVEVTNEPPPGQPRQADTEQHPSAVHGIFREIEEAERASVGVHNNMSVMFAGMICPVICEEESRVKIIHGHTEIWIPRANANKALSSKAPREREPGWNDVSTNPLITPHRP